MEAQVMGALTPELEQVGKTPQASFRLDGETIDLLDALGRKLGLNRTAVIKMLVRRAADAEGVRPAAPPAEATDG
jgi:hypothetical protein